MPVHAGFGGSVATVVVYLALMWVPGGLAAVALGVRGWQLAASAPVVSYFIGGLAGPLLSMLGLRYDWTSFAVATVIVVALCAGVRWLSTRSKSAAEPKPTERATDWLRSSHAVVALFVLIAAVVGGYIVLRGMGWIDSIPQDGDAVFEANGIRYIAETGNGGLFAMANTNWYDPPNSVFYPNAYHLIAALVFTATKASIPLVLDANTILVPGLLALSLVATVRVFRGRVSTACYTALIAVSVAAGVYENMVRGPLLPYGLSMVLLPVALIALHRYLERPAPDTGALGVITIVGLLLIHSSALFSFTLLALPILIQRWYTHRGQLGREILRMVMLVAGVVVVAAPALLGALHSASAFASVVWPVQMTVSRAVGSLLTFQHTETVAQIVLAVALWIGLATARGMAGLRWVLGSALLTGLAFLAVAGFNNPVIITLARPWWDDQYRLIALASMPLAVIAAYGMTRVQDGLLALVRRVRNQIATRVLAGTAVVVLLAAFVVLTKGLYYGLDSSIVARGYGTGPGTKAHDLAVGPDEVVAMQQLATLVKPGDRVMNDRYDGSVWMYAIAGVQPVAGHYDASWMPPEIALLAEKFNQYDTDAAVRAAVAHLRVTYVMVDTGFVRKYDTRQPGLTNLADCDFLTQVYANSDATIYRIQPKP